MLNLENIGLFECQRILITNYLFTLPSITRCDKEEDLAMIAAQQYYIEYNTDMSMDRLYTLIPNFIPDYCLTGIEKAMDRWAALVVQAYKKSYYLKDKAQPLRVKEDVVSYAKYKWPLLFSRFYEAYR